MKIRQILVTGGAGYVGAVLVPKLLKKGYFVKVLDWFIFGNQVFAAHKNHPRLIQIKGDIRDKNLLKKSLNNTGAVIHLACISNDPSYELDPNLGKSVNYAGTIQLIDLAKESGVKRFIYASSSSVYGIKSEAEVTEDLPLTPLTDYSKYKALCEEYLLSKQSPDFTVLILRPATVCGYSPRLRLDLTVNILTINALHQQKIRVYGGQQKRPNIHIADMTDLYVNSLQYPARKIAGKIYNVGYENYTVLELAQLVKKTLGQPHIQIEILPSADLRSYHISSQKINGELGFTPKHALTEAIRDLQKKYYSGEITHPLTNIYYYNMKTMQKWGHLFTYA